MLPVFLYVLLSTPPSWSFAVIGDTQSRPQVLARATKHMRTQKLELGVHLGDIARCYWKRWWRQVRRDLRSTNIPWYMVLGNHDIYRCSNFHRDSRLVYRFMRFWGTKSTFQSFVHRGKRFVLLNSASSWISRSHVRRLKRILAVAQPKSVFIFLHHPLAVRRNFRVYYDNGKRWTWYSKFDGLSYYSGSRKLTRLLVKEKSKILAVFHGHYHAYRRYQYTGIPIYCSGGGGGRLETKWDFYHYLIITVSGDSYKVRIVKLL